MPTESTTKARKEAARRRPMVNEDDGFMREQESSHAR
jgi:hypothetical protein